MRLTPATILLILAVIAFLLAAFGVALGRVDLLALGLALFAASFLVDRGGGVFRR